MKSKETYETRLEMAHMHDEFLERLDAAMKQHNYVEASWLCYAIFEQRITRIVEKHITKCPKQNRNDNKYHVGIRTKITCLKKLSKVQYGAYANFDSKLLSEIAGWCKKRNTLMHGLVSLELYKKYDKEFKDLAESGTPMVKKLYEEASKVREWCRSDHKFGAFPVIKCRCEYRCVYERK